MTPFIDAHGAADPEHLDSWSLVDPARLLRRLAAKTPLRLVRA